MEQLKSFARYISPYRWQIASGIFFILCSMAFGLLVPYLVGKAVDDLSHEVTWYKVTYYPLVILAVNASSGVFLFLQRRLLINTSRHIEFDMRQSFYAALVDQPLGYFHNNRVGDLMARATNDLAAIRQIVGPMILYSFQAIFALCISLPIMLNISVKLTVLLLIPMPLVSLTVKYLGAQIHTRFEKIQGFFSDITARAQENLTGVRVVRAYAQEGAEIDEFQKLNWEYADQNLRLVKFAAAMRPLLFFFIGLGFVIIVAVGVPMAVRGEITAGDFTAFILYLQRMIWYLIALGYVVNLYQRGTASLKRFNTILEAEPTIRDKPDTHEQPPIKGKIQFRDLTFAYNGKPVLEDINLTIEQGKTVAFVGKTGSGKSTLVSLIPRLLDAPDGTVLVDDKPVREFPLAQLRRAIGFVPQETFLFSDTLANNIAFGVDGRPRKAKSVPPAIAGGFLPDKGKSEISPLLIPDAASRPFSGVISVEKSAEIAGLADDIKDFPDKYEQLVGERGITLSGGQKQRTAIARAVMRDPRILILDDSLSAVDTYTEEKILHNLRDVRLDRTTLIVSHRVSTIRDADLICVLHEGRIIERGTHDELLKIDGEY
ncbi:MAG TPA: ABC transporter ATP-binding protein, partial [Pyrinomonadaceae bacterium]|nr:ABC transporter ATP-binding protein [Pyrinomonadaceae bacterium]